MSSISRFGFVLIAVAVAVVLQGCGGGGAGTTTTTTTTTAPPTPPSPPPTPAPTTPPPTPAPPTPAPPTPAPPTPPPSEHFCTTAACCKAKVTLQSTFDGQICDEFYSSGAGVAISMLKTNTWAWRDAGSLFTAEPRSKMDAKTAQSISIIGSSKPTHPYASYGPNAGKWGIVSSIERDGNFWKYFTYCPKPATLCAQCTDGFACPLKSAPGIAREVLPASFTYNQFKKEKDEVYAQTGTSACKQPYPHQYNEFNTNGLSKSGLGGIFIVNSGGAASRNHEPSARDVCKFMAMANETRATPWPLYVYDVPHHSTQSSLYIAKYLECNSQDVVVV